MREPFGNNAVNSDGEKELVSSESLEALTAFFKNGVTQIRAATTIETCEDLICQKTLVAYESINEIDIQSSASPLLAKVLQLLRFNLLCPDERFSQYLVSSLQDSPSKSISTIIEVIEILESVVVEHLRQEGIEDEAIGLVIHILQDYRKKILLLLEPVNQANTSCFQVVENAQSISSRNFEQIKGKKGLGQRGDRMIAMTAGGAFIGGTIAQAPGAIIGATAGAFRVIREG
jgi:hypothetical protein